MRERDQVEEINTFQGGKWRGKYGVCVEGCCLQIPLQHTIVLIFGVHREACIIFGGELDGAAKDQLQAREGPVFQVIIIVVVGYFFVNSNSTRVVRV